MNKPAFLIRALIRLAILARRNRESYSPFSVNWVAYNAEFRAHLTAAQIAGKFLR